MFHKFNNRIVLSLSLFYLFFSCQNNDPHKIKLAEGDFQSYPVSQAASSVLQIKPEEQRAIAILHFENQTHEKDLNWLRRGLSDMLVTELSQSPYLNIITMQRLQEVAGRSKQGGGNLRNFEFAANTARQAKAELILTGRFYQQNDNLHIEVDILDAPTMQVLHQESVQGSGLEEIFTMVDSLSERVRANVRGNIGGARPPAFELTKMTASLEAFRCYSRALEQTEKLLWNESEKWLEKAVQYDSTFAGAYLMLARLKFDMGKPAEGRLALQKTRRYRDKLSDPDQLRLQLLEHTLQGDYDKILPLLETAVNRFPGDIQLRIQLARSYRNFRNLDRALEEFETVLEMDPNRKLVYNDLGYVFAERGDFTTALQYIDKYQKLAPDEPNPYDSKGEILMWAGRLDEAAVQLKIALQKLPTFYHSARRLSEIALEKSDYQEALKYINQTIRMAPNKSIRDGLTYYKAILLWRFEKNKEALALLNSRIAAHPLEVSPVSIAGRIYLSQGDTVKAREVFQQAVNRYSHYLDEHQPNPRELDQLLGLALRAPLPVEEMIPLLKKVHLETDNPGFQGAITNFVLGLMYLRKGDIASGGKCLEDNAPQLFDIIAVNRKGGWGSLWSFVLESLDYQCQDQPIEKHAFSRQLMDYARKTNRKDLEIIARLSRSRYFGLNRQIESAAREYTSAGVPMEHSWRVVGPFSALNVSPFNHPYPPEKTIDLNGTYDTNRREICWQKANDGYFDGYVDLKSIFKQNAWSVGYGLIYVYSPDERKVQIRLGSDEACKLWLNERLIWQHYLKREALLDRDLLTVVLHPGYNKLLIKVTNTDGEWGYYLRVTDEFGDGFPDITFHSPDEVSEPLSMEGQQL